MLLSAERLGPARPVALPAPPPAEQVVPWALVLVGLLLAAALERVGIGLVPLLALVLGVLLVVGLARRPGPVVCALVTLLPLQTALLSLLFRLGAPLPAVKGLGMLKEAAVASLCLAAVPVLTRTRLRALDVLLAGLLALCTLYLLLPVVLPGLLADVPFVVRLYAWRGNGLCLLAFLALRGVDVPEAWRRRAQTGAVVAGVVVAAGALVEVADNALWNTFLSGGLGVDAYRASVLDVGTGAGEDLLTRGLIGGEAVVRAGSVLLSPLTLAFYLLVPIGLVAARLVRRGITPLPTAALGVLAAGLLATLTRSAVAGALLGGCVLLLACGARGRVRGLVAVVALAAVLAQTGAASLLSGRVEEARSGVDVSASGHEDRVREAAHALRDRPLGLGLGTAAGVGDRFDTSGRLTTENAYLQVGLELGLVAMVVFVAAFGALLRELWRERDHPSRSVLVPGVLFATVALCLTGMFLHVWQDFTVSISFWVLAALALPLPRQAA